MRVAVIGTSNAVMHQGWRAFLQRLDLGEVHNFSLGGSPNVLLPYRVPDIDCDWYDTVVIDTLVNDLWCTSAGTMTGVRARQIMADTLGYFTARGLRAVLLLLPTNDPTLDQFRLRSDYLAIAAAYGAVAVDGYHVAEALLAHGIAADAVFSDPGHMAPPAAMLTAQRVADALLALPPRRAASTAAYPYQVHPLTDATVAMVDRGTSLLRGRYGCIPAGACVNFRFDEEQELVALSLNEAQTSAVVEIRSEHGRVVKDLRFAGANEPPLRHAITPLVAAVAGRDITVRVLPAAEAAAAAPEISSHARGGVATDVLELEAIVIRRRAAPAPFVPAAGVAPPPAPPLSRWERGVAALMAMPDNRQTQTRLAALFGELFGGARDFSLYRPADLLRDIGRLAMAAGETDAARSALREALRQRPDGVFIRALLDGLG